MKAPRDQERRGRATLLDVARTAGVGLATVDRVLNERGNFSAATQARVINAARELNLNRILPDRHLRTLRIEVLITRPDLPLNQRFGEEFEGLNRRIDKSVVIHRSILKSDDPIVLASRLRDSPCDGIVVNMEANATIHAAIGDVTKQGKAVVTMMSDIPGSSRLAYAGTDHLAAGRTAAYFMGAMARQPGGVVVLCNRLGFDAHKERVLGFSEGLRCHAPHLDVLAVIEGQDDIYVSERKLRRFLANKSGVVGIYNTGAANRAVAAVIRNGPFAERPIFIGHELTSFTYTALQDGTMNLAIDQSPELQARFAVDVLMQHFGVAELREISPPYHSNVPFTLYSPENVGKAL